MELFVWDRHFNTGLQGLDEQHRALIDLFNELHRALFDLSLPPDRRAMVLRTTVAAAPLPAFGVRVCRHTTHLSHSPPT